jgi:uncharacterized protein
MLNIKIQRMSLLFDGNVVFQNLNQDPVIASLKNLLHLISSKDSKLEEIFRQYHHFCSLATQVNWPEHLWNLILQDENRLTHQISQSRKQRIDSNLRELALHDLMLWRELAQLTAKEIKEEIQNRINQEVFESQSIWTEAPFAPKCWPVWYTDSEKIESDLNHAEHYLFEARNRVREALSLGNLDETVDELSSFYSEIGSGLFSQALAFKWQGNLQRLVGVKADPFRKEQLIGQEREQGIVLQNTEFFLAGYPANNVILYGNRGTGKSSLVKSLLQEYCNQGLRLVELSKTDLMDFPKVIRQLAMHPQKFIIFIDDLSFEESEAEFKTLKTLLEGGLEGKPQNVLIYATSNRRHLVRESFSERQGDEVNRRDNMEEKLSLADRFGITVTFPSPDQAGYLKIVEELAIQQGIQMDREQLRQQALRWVMMHNARSGRSARQFIDYLAASQGVAAK